MKKRKNSISIKINGTEQDFKEENFSKKQSANENPTTNTSTEHSNSTDDTETSNINKEQLSETDQLERLILNDKERELRQQFETKAKKRQSSHLREQDSYRSSSSASKSISSNYRKGRHFNKRWRSSLFAFLLAIFVGTSFGFIVKKVITTDQVFETIANNNVEDLNFERNEQRATESATKEQTTLQVNIDPQMFFVVQAGVFSTEESAKQFSEDIIDKNIAAYTMSDEDQLYVYIGIANTLETAKDLGTFYESEEVEFYAKEFFIDGKQLSVLKDDEQNFFETALPLYEQLITTSTSLILGDNFLDGWQNEIKQRLNNIEQFDISDDKIMLLKEDLVAACNLILTNTESISKEHTSQLQTLLLSFLETYKSL